jgi:O-antigen/teichoic acid export membrane protein
LIVFFAGEWILRLISNPEFLEERFYGFGSVEAFSVVGWIFFVYFVSSLFTYILIAYKSEKKMLMINSIVAIVNIVGNLILIPMYSFIGSAWATLGSQILLVILTGYAAYNTYKKIG